MKTGRIIALIIAAMLLFAACTGNTDNNGRYTMEELKKMEVATGTFLEGRYSSGGGMDGAYTSISMTKKDGEVTVTKDSLPYQGMAEVILVYRASETAMDDLEKVIKEYNLPAWDILERDEEAIALDRPTASISMFYDNSRVGGNSFETYSVGFDDKLPSGGRNALNEFTEHISRWVTRDNLVSSYVIDRGRGFEEVILTGPEAARSILEHYHEVEDGLASGMVLVENGVDNVEGSPCYIFRLGTDTPEKFTAESWWAVDTMLQNVYSMNYMTGEYEFLFRY